MSDWVHPYYDDVDNMRLAEFVAWHAPDVTVQFANHPPARGHDQMRGAIGHFWETIGGLKHNISNVWDTGDGTTVVEADIDYTRLDGKVVVTPCVTLLHRVEQGIDSVRIFVDLAPVFAPAEAPADAVTA
jgi:ketosteroid isomerase-like protein